MLRYWVLLCTSVAGASYAQGDLTWRGVRGPELKALFSDHELADGVHYAYRFDKDGTVSGFSMGKKVSGTWRISGNEFCWTLARRRTAEECYQVEAQGRSVRLLRDGYEALTATVTPVDTRNGESR
jgi:hypothetical protein